MVDATHLAIRQTVLPMAHWLGQTQFEPLPPMARFVFRGDVHAQDKLSTALSLRIPPVLRAMSGGDVSILWQGPDEFLVLATEDQKASLLTTIENTCGAVAHSLVDVSHRNVGFTLEGPEVELLLASAVQLDLSVPSFPVGMTTRTLFAKADITLWRQGDQRFHIETWRSFLPYVTGLLHEGARGL